MHEPWLFCPLVHSRKGIKPTRADRASTRTWPDLTRGDITISTIRHARAFLDAPSRSIEASRDLPFIQSEVSDDRSPPENGFNWLFTSVFQWAHEYKGTTDLGGLVSFITISDAR